MSDPKRKFKVKFLHNIEVEVMAECHSHATTKRRNQLRENGTKGILVLEYCHEIAVEE